MPSNLIELKDYNLEFILLYYLHIFNSPIRGGYNTQEETKKKRKGRTKDDKVKYVCWTK